MILSAIAERLKRRSKDDFKGRHFEASLILQAVCWYLRSVNAGEKRHRRVGVKMHHGASSQGYVERQVSI